MKMSPDDFNAILKDMTAAKASQAALVDYIRTLDSIGSCCARIDPKGMRLRNHGDFAAYFVEKSDETYTSAEKAMNDARPDTTNIKSSVPVMPLPIFRHHIASLLPLIRSEHPLPILKDITNIRQTDQDFFQNYNLRMVAQAIYSSTYDKLKEGIDPHMKGVIRQLQTEAIMTGTAGLCFGTDGEDFWFEFLPFDSIFLSNSGRWIAINREIYKGEDLSGFSFTASAAFQPFAESDSYEATREYFEIYDLYDKELHTISTDGHKIRKTRSFAETGDCNIIIFSLGHRNPDSLYAGGLIEITAVIAEELIVSASVINHLAKESGITKPIISGNLANDKEFLEQLNDPELLYAMCKSGGIDRNDFNVQLWTRVNNLNEWLAYWQFLHNLLVQYQFLPEISRGLATPNTAYMKAGTAAELSRPRTIFADMLVRETADLYEQIYRKTLNFMRAHTELRIVRDTLSDKQIALLAKSYRISIRVKDIKATPDEERSAQMTGMLQASQALLPAVQSIAALVQTSKLQINTTALIGKILEDTFGLSIYEFAEPIMEETPSVSAAGASPPPADAGGGMPPALGVQSAQDFDEQTIVDSVVTYLSTRGREDLISVYVRLAPEVQRQVATRLRSLREAKDMEGIEDLFAILTEADGASNPDDLVISQLG